MARRGFTLIAAAAVGTSCGVAAFSSSLPARRSVPPLRASFFKGFASMAGLSSLPVGDRPLFLPENVPDGLPSWETMEKAIAETDVGRRAEEDSRLWAAGAGRPHTDAALRLFGTTGEPRVIFYRDTAAWCPYCQKTWMLLEEKQIPYRVEKINMRSYGEKPGWYLRLVPSGLLPAVSLDGRLITESLVIMQLLDATFGAPRRAMLPPAGSEALERAEELLQLERKLFGWWCQSIFRPGGGRSEIGFRETLDEVDRALGETPGPWFLGPYPGNGGSPGGIANADCGPSLVDLTYVPHLERMAASAVYWRGLRIRGNSRWPNIDRWFDALELRPSYMASKSDFYTHVRDIPPQYGDGFFGDGAAVDAAAAAVAGQDGSWSLPLPSLRGPDTGPGFDGLGPLEPVLPSNDPGVELACQEAALRLIRNRAAVTRFACRGAGTSSGWSNRPGRALLSDPDAVPNDDVASDVSLVLRAVAAALLAGETTTAAAALSTAAVAASAVAKAGGGGGDATGVAGRAAAVAQCVEYLRDRVGVPRDMPYPAARQLRAHLNWARDMVLAAPANGP